MALSTFTFFCHLQNIFIFPGFHTHYTTILHSSLPTAFISYHSIFSPCGFNYSRCLRKGKAQDLPRSVLCMILLGPIQLLFFLIVPYVADFKCLNFPKSPIPCFFSGPQLLGLLKLVSVFQASVAPYSPRSASCFQSFSQPEV